MTNNKYKRHVTGPENNSSPFEEARTLQVEIHYYDFPKEIYGLYSPETTTSQILINENISLEKQEKVCEYIIAHHTSFNSQAPAYCIDESTYQELEKKKGIFARSKRQKNVSASLELN